MPKLAAPTTVIVAVIIIVVTVPTTRVPITRVTPIVVPPCVTAVRTVVVSIARGAARVAPVAILAFITALRFRPPMAA